jgi:hypothetical protein
MAVIFSGLLKDSIELFNSYDVKSSVVAITDFPFENKCKR